MEEELIKNKELIISIFINESFRGQQLLDGTIVEFR
jgi:hypothetical protein